MARHFAVMSLGQSRIGADVMCSEGDLLAWAQLEANMPGPLLCRPYETILSVARGTDGDSTRMEELMCPRPEAFLGMYELVLKKK